MTNCDVPTSSAEALSKLCRELPKGSTVLDVGAGSKAHAEYMKAAGYDVFTNDIVGDHDFLGDFNTIALHMDQQFDCVWASHILEHQLNVNQFLQNLKHVTKEGGIIAITVPPRKDKLVGGHVSLFTPLSLVYNVVLAGLDCSKACVKWYGYNISLIIRKKDIVLPDDLHYDRGDIEKLSQYFPVEVKQRTEGFSLREVNWQGCTLYETH